MHFKPKQFSRSITMLDSSVIWITLLVFLCVFKESKSGTICLSCSNLADGEFCAGHEMCKNNEVCFIQKYSTNRNEYRYDVGCALPELCRKDLTGNIFGKRSDHSHVLCHKCCNNTDICNARLSCNDTLSIPQQKCLSCSEIEDPRICQNTTTCAKDEVCYLHKYRTASKQQLYDVGCKHSALCTHGYTNSFGRRSIAGVHQECESCCSGTALCNHDLRCDNNTQKTINSTCSTLNECIGNLVCIAGVCQCHEQYYWNINTCIERHSANERCFDDHQCKIYLRCKQNTCQCTNNKYWNGSICTPKKSYNSYCKLSDECISTMYCTHGVCSCAHDDYWSGSVCVAKKHFNSTCRENEECKNAFRCINETCECMPTEYLDGSQCTQKRLECEDISVNMDGIYTIHPGGGDTGVLVYCIMRQNKKWTVIQRRVNGSVDFYRTWNDYKHGFGSAHGEYWLGNDNIHLISTNGQHELSIYMERPNKEYRWGNYSTFSIANEISKYTLNVGGYTGTANFNGLDVKSARSANGQAFSTMDNDNDNQSGGSCARQYKSAWWFNFCDDVDLNRHQMYWMSWSDISKSIIMIRRT